MEQTPDTTTAVTLPSIKLPERWTEERDRRHYVKRFGNERDDYFYAGLLQVRASREYLVFEIRVTMDCVLHAYPGPGGSAADFLPAAASLSVIRLLAKPLGLDLAPGFYASVDGAAHALRLTDEVLQRRALSPDKPWLYELVELAGILTKAADELNESVRVACEA